MQWYQKVQIGSKTLKWNTMFQPRFNAHHRDTSPLNCSSTRPGKVATTPHPTRMEGSIMVALMHHHMIHRGLEVWCGGTNKRMNLQSSKKNCMQWSIPNARAAHNGIHCPRLSKPLSSDSVVRQFNLKVKKI